MITSASAFRRNSSALCGLCFAIVLAWCGRATAQQTAAEDTYQRPGYQLFRQNEDWSGLANFDRSASGDMFDPIKYVPLAADGDIWASFGGSARTRFEAWENFGFKQTPANRDQFLLTRFFLHSDLHLGENLRVFVEGKGAYSTDRNLPGGRRTLDIDEFDLHQAFVDFTVPLGEANKLTIRGGRQMLLFGNERLVSPLVWSNTMRTWDGVSLIFDVDDWKITGFWTHFVPVQKYDFNTRDANNEFWGVYATSKCPELNINVDLYYLGLHNDFVSSGRFNGTAGQEDRQTFGSRMWGLCGQSGFDYELEGAYQFGDVGRGDINAYMLATELGYQFTDCPATPRAFLGFDVASGDNNSGGHVETFNQLFPLGHKYLGYMDVVGRQNVTAFDFGLQCKPMPKLTARVAGHFFWRYDESDALYNAGGGVVRAGGGPGSEIGQEIDVTLQYKIGRHWAALVGYSHFFAGDFIDNTGRADDIDFTYLQLSFTF